MDLLETLLTRRSPALNTLTAPGPSPDQVRTMLTAAARVPDHGKLVPWRFVVVLGQARNTLGSVVNKAWLSDHASDSPDVQRAATIQWAGRFSAPLIVVVVSSPVPSLKVPAWEQELSAGACCMNLLLAAKAMGFGGVWLSEWYAYDPRITAHLGLSERERIAGIMHIGTVSEQRTDRDRPDLGKIVTYAPQGV